MRIIFTLMFLISLLFSSCQRDWISNEFIKADGSTLPDYGVTSEEPAKEEPIVIKKTDITNSKVFSITDRMVIPVGDKEDTLGILEGSNDELPIGPSSFTVDSDGNIHIIDRINGFVKSFNNEKALINSISLEERKHSILDIAISANNQIALADINNNLIYLLSREAKKLADYNKTIRFQELFDFSGLYNTIKGNIFIRYGDQQSLKINENGLHLPFLSIISRNENLFLRTKKLSSSISMLFMSSREQSSDYKGNTEKQIEIAIGLPVLSITLLDTDSANRAYLLVEADDGSNEIVRVKRYVIRAGPKEEDWSKPFEIPLDVYAFPFKDIIVSPDGIVYAMLVYKDRVEVTKWKAE